MRLSETVREQIRNVLFGFRLSWRGGRVRTVAIVLVPLAESLIPAALALVLRALVNRAVDVVGSGESGLDELGIYVLLSLLLTVGLAVSQSLQQYLAQSHMEALQQRVTLEIMEHASTLDFAYYEDPDAQDMFRLARQSPAQQAQEMLVKCVRAVAASITIGSLLLILARIEPRLLLYFLPLALPYLWFRSWVAKARFQISRGQQRGRRWADYFSSQVTSEGSIPEVRSYNLTPLFIRQLRERLAVIRGENERSYRMELYGSLAFNILAVVVVHIALFQVADRVTSGDLTVGDIAIFATAAAGLRRAIDILVLSIGGLRWHTSHLQNLRAFFALEPTVGVLRPQPADGPAVRVVDSEDLGAADPAPPAGAFVVDDLTFTYPRAPGPTLRNLSFTIATGETVALVGRNGSGKSTLVKLATRLYAPDSGRILLAGRDVHRVEEDYVRQQLAVVFQQFNRFNATAGESIAMGNWTELLENPAGVRAVAERMGLDDVIRSLPNGYDEMLGRMFGHTSLSGGQWQALAIARAFARDAPIMILDEPTSNLDAEAEFEVFSHFKELARGRSTLLISHRFSTLALADRVVVLEDGGASEQGTHEELLALGGTYARLYRLYRVQGEADVWHDDAAGPASASS